MFPTPPLLQVDSVSFSYGTRCILDHLSFSVHQGETVALLGNSGGGKTTLFHLITGLRSPATGRILIDGQLGKQELVVYMMQQDLLLPWRTVMGNLMLIGELTAPRGFFRRKERHRYLEDWKRRAELLLHEVGLQGEGQRYPHELSGGMRQRVSLARALLHNRPLLLLDEPFTALDVVIREQIYALLFHLKEKYRLTILLITHDFNDALQLADRLYVLQDGKIGSELTLSTQMREDPLVMETTRKTLRRSFLRRGAAL